MRADFRKEHVGKDGAKKRKASKGRQPWLVLEGGGWIGMVKLSAGRKRLGDVCGDPLRVSQFKTVDEVLVSTRRWYFAWNEATQSSADNTSTGQRPTPEHCFIPTTSTPHVSVNLRDWDCLLYRDLYN